MRVDCGKLDPGAVIRPVLGEWHPRMPERLDEEELADWRAGRNVSARRTDDRHAPRGRRRIRKTTWGAAVKPPPPQFRFLPYKGTFWKTGPEPPI
jgi:hypothetical protein